MIQGVRALLCACFQKECIVYTALRLGVYGCTCARAARVRVVHPKHMATLCETTIIAIGGPNAIAVLRAPPRLTASGSPSRFGVKVKHLVRGQTREWASTPRHSGGRNPIAQSEHVLLDLFGVRHRPDPLAHRFSPWRGARGGGWNQSPNGEYPCVTEMRVLQGILHPIGPLAVQSAGGSGRGMLGARLVLILQSLIVGTGVPRSCAPDGPPLCVPTCEDDRLDM